MRQNFNRKCTKGDLELPNQVIAQTELKLEEDAVFFHKLILLGPQLSGKPPADKQRHSQSGKALRKARVAEGAPRNTIRVRTDHRRQARDSGQKMI